jgi:GntR family transcriptional regulator, rspAB operon transcriptional repressor
MPRLRAIPQPLPLAKMAYERLRDSILTGQLQPGQIYNEMALAKELGISRTPVREALLELSAQGLVTFLPRKGVAIKHYTRKDVIEIFELRRVIELAAIENVTRAEPPLDLSKIERSLNNQRKSAAKNDFIAFMKADRIFHATFSELTKNRHFVRIVENIRDLVNFMGMQGLSTRGRAETVIEEHEKVLEAVEKRKPLKAKEAMGYHLDQSEKAVLEGYNSQSDK